MRHIPGFVRRWFHRFKRRLGITELAERAAALAENQAGLMERCLLLEERGARFEAAAAAARERLDVFTARTAKQEAEIDVLCEGKKRLEERCLELTAKLNAAAAAARERHAAIAARTAEQKTEIDTLHEDKKRLEERGRELAAKLEAAAAAAAERHDLLAARTAKQEAEIAALCEGKKRLEERGRELSTQLDAALLTLSARCLASESRHTETAAAIAALKAVDTERRDELTGARREMREALRDLEEGASASAASAAHERARLSQQNAAMANSINALECGGVEKARLIGALQERGAALHAQIRQTAALLERLLDEHIALQSEVRGGAGSGGTCADLVIPDGYSADEVIRELQEAAPAAFPIWAKTFAAGRKSYAGFPPDSCSMPGHGGAEAFGAFIKGRVRGRVLDLGCGPQSTPVYLSGYPPELICGLDPLPPTSPHPFAFVRGYAEKLPFPAASFDTVIAATSFDHVLLPDRAVAEICRVLKRYGRLLLWEGVDARWRDSFASYDPYAETPFAPADAFHLFHFSPDSCLAFFGEFFDIVRTDSAIPGSLFLEGLLRPSDARGGPTPRPDIASTH